MNIVRTAIEALAAVLGGTQSLHTNSFDEALALPTEEAVRIALRTQQVIAHETGVARTIDPLGGSYYLEELTGRLEAEAYDYFHRIERARRGDRGDPGELLPARDRGGELPLPVRGRGRRADVVGVNGYEIAGRSRLAILRIDPALEREQVDRVQALRDRRDTAAAEAALARLKADAAVDDRNLMEPIVDAARRT